METTVVTVFDGLLGTVRRTRRRAETALRRARVGLAGALHEETAQGTVEYAVLVGVLVVFAIVAIVAFRGKVSDLWEAITEAMDTI